MMRRRGCITAKLIASMLSMSGMHHLVTMDLYHKEIQGFFNFPIDNLRASPFLIQYIQDNIPDYINGVVVARYPAVTRRASSFAERLRLSLAVIHGEVKEHDDGRNSPFNDKLLTPRKNQVVRKSKPPLYIVGDIIDRIAFVIDDVIDEVEGLIAAVQLLKDHGAKEVYVVATHAVLPDNEFEVLQESCIDKVLVTNTVDNPLKRYSKIQTIDISMMLAEAIRRIYNEESMSYLFKNIPLED
jgi:ribose-phosphate pyrophosphokinase